MNKTILNELGIRASKDIPIEDIFNPAIDATNYGLDKKDMKKLGVLKTFCQAYNIEIPVPKQYKISSPNDAVKLMYNIMRDMDHEEVWVIYLNRAHNVIEKKQVCIGGLDASIIDNKRIIKRALEVNAKGFILCHNHPSGYINPSNVDIRETEKIKKMVDLFDISLVDHVIISSSEYYSFAEDTISEVKLSQNE